MPHPPEATVITPLIQRQQAPSALHIQPRRRTPPIHLLPAILTLVLFFLTIIITLDVSSGRCAIPHLCQALGGNSEANEVVWQRNTGAYSPWHSQGSEGGDTGLPLGCKVDQVSILHRHTARFPTIASGELLRDTLEKIAKRGVPAPTHRPELAFLAHADFNLSAWAFEELTDQGKREAWDSGSVIARRYSRLVNRNGVFARSTNSNRVLNTANFWLQGFHGVEFNLTATEFPQPNVVIPEGKNCNNTLSVHNCKAFEATNPVPGTKQRDALMPLLRPAADRLNALLKPRPPFEAIDIVHIVNMCAYDSQVRGDKWTGWSRWCHVLLQHEFEVVGYIADVERWYHVGEGSRFGRVLGAGYVNELIARLSDSAPKDHTTTNRTLDSDVAKFPPGGRRFFIDFTHDNEMIEILTALGVYPQHRKLPTDAVQARRTYIISELIPFGARWAFERISCDLNGWEPDPDGDQLVDDGRRDYVRVLINDKVATIGHMACRSSNFYEHGMCDLESFIESQQWSASDVDWGVCSLK